MINLVGGCLLLGFTFLTLNCVYFIKLRTVLAVWRIQPANGMEKNTQFQNQIYWQ